MEVTFTHHKKFQKEFKKLLKELTPSEKLHQNYLDEANQFIYEHNYYSSLDKAEGNELSVKKLKLVTSKIFNRSYLVAYIDNDWFESVGRNFNAGASLSLQIFNLQSPPLVILPESSARLRNKDFLSILEHEFVHINQGILQKFPQTNNFSKEPFMTLINYTYAEYQAYFIQYFHYPDTYLQEVDIDKYSLQDWSVLRGYTQALEGLVFAIYQGELSPESVEQMLKSIPEQLSIGFTQIELPENYGLEYTENFPRFLGIAATNILQKIPSPSANKSFHTLTQWIIANLNINKSNEQ